MANRVADAAVMLLLDTSGFQQQVDQAQQTINDLKAQLTAVQQSATSMGGQGGGGSTPVSGSRGTTAATNILSAAEQTDPQLGGFSTLPGAISSATDPNSPSGRGWSLGEDVGAAWNFVKARFGFGGSSGASPTALGSSVMQGAAQGVEQGKGGFSEAVKKAVDEAIHAGMDEAEIGSPSKRAAREIGNPIMTGAALGVMGGVGAVTGAMMSSIGFSLNMWRNNLMGGLFGGFLPGMGGMPGLNPVGPSLLGGGLGQWMGAIGTSFGMEMGLGGFPGMGGGLFGLLGGLGVMSRMFMGMMPTGGLGGMFGGSGSGGLLGGLGGILGMMGLFGGLLGGGGGMGGMGGLLGMGMMGGMLGGGGMGGLGGLLGLGLLGGLLGGGGGIFGGGGGGGLGGGLGDMAGTFFGFKKILTPEQALSEGQFANIGIGDEGEGGFQDYPYRGGYVMTINNNFGNGIFPPGMTETEQGVSLGILRSMRRLGVF